MTLKTVYRKSTDEIFDKLFFRIRNSVELDKNEQ